MSTSLKKLKIWSHKGKKVASLMGSPLFNMFSDVIEGNEGFIPAGYEHRPDLIANLFTGSAYNWQLVMMANGLSDPFESLNVNDRISLL